MSHLKRKLGWSETVEVPILNTSAREYKFSDNESTLRGVVCEGIIIHTDELGIARSGRAILPLAEIKKGLITLATSKQKLRNKELPLEVFLKNDNAVTEMKPFLIDIPKSVLILPNSANLVLPAGPPAGYTLVVTFFYRAFNENVDKVDEDGFIIESN